MLGIPARLGPVVRSGLLSPVGVARAGLDLVLPRTPVGDDAAVGQLIAARFGRQVADRLVEPLLGSIHAAPIADLSAAATAPQILATARRSRSLLRALRAGAPGGSAAPAGPIFATPRRGTGAIVERLVEGLRDSGAAWHTDEVRRVAPHAAGVDVDGGHFDGVVLAVGAPAAARLLGEAAPAGLGAVESTTVVLVTMSFAAADLPVPEGVNGFLVPAGEGRLVTACSFGSNKWPHWADAGTTLLRVSTGRHGDDRASRLDDAALAERLADEVTTALGRRATPRQVRVSRWPGAFPYYRTGHVQRAAAIEDELATRSRRVSLAGSSYRGAGIPACIASGRRAARQLLGASSSGDSLSAR